MHDEGPSAAELADAKTYLIGSFPTQFDSTGAIAGTLLQVQEEGLGIDYINERNGFIAAVTLEDARRVARRLFDAAELGFTVVGMPEKLTPTREVGPGGS